MLTIQFDPKRIDAIAAASDLGGCELPGGAIGISINGRAVYRKGFGLANIELPVCLSPTVRLRIGSVTKQFTCLAFMLLSEEGKGGIDDPLSKLFPELHPATRHVTFRQLMGHTSGLRDVYEIFTRFNEPYSHYGGVAQSVSSDQLLALYRKIDDVDSPPSTRWIYNNGGYLLLSAAIERLSGQTLEEVMRKRIFEPLGMYDTLLLRSDAQFLPNRGSQHVVTPGGGYERMYWGVDSHLGAGAIVSTVDDLLRWMANMDTPVVGNATTWAAMKAPQKLRNGTSTGYGLGLKIDHYRGVETLSHSGNALGGNAQVMKVPASGLDVVVLINRQDVLCTELTNQILDACLPELLPIPKPTPGSFASGIFRSPTTGRVIQLFSKVFLPYNQTERQVVSIDGLDLPFELDPAGVLKMGAGTEDEKQSVMLQGDTPQPSAIRFNDFGNIDELERLPSVSGSDGRRIVGSYRAGPIDTEATISEVDEELQLEISGPFGSVPYRVESLAENLWRVRPKCRSRVEFLGGILSIKEDGNAIEFSIFQMRKILFRRCT